jgi:subtilisin family serine protease
MVVAAGNGDDSGNPENACDFSPASSSSVITVGASNQVDSVASFSNYGSCVTLLAPGVKVTSIGDGGAALEAGGGGKSGVNGVKSDFGQASGTSFAAPYVAGAVALMLGEAGPVRPDEVKKRLVSGSSTGKLSGIRSGTPNALLNEYEMSFGVDSAATTSTVGWTMLSTVSLATLCLLL